MPVTEKKYPEWVQAHRTKGTTVKKKGDAYYLYKRTSRRVAGKKYPQPVDTYIGVITPDGVVEGVHKKVQMSEIEVREFGYSRAVWQLCPAGWKEPLGKDWEDVLLMIIKKQSPATYLEKEHVIKAESETRYNVASMAGSLSRRIYMEHGVNTRDLECLKTVFVLYHGKDVSLAKMSEAHSNVLKALGVDISLC